MTHDLREALRLGSRIALMEAGKLVTVHTPQEFLTVDGPVGIRLCEGFRGNSGNGCRSRGIMNVIRFIVQNHSQVLELTLEHLMAGWLLDSVRDADWSSAGHRHRALAAME